VEENKEPRKEESDAAALLKSAGRQLVPLLVTAGSLIGFVAFAGAVIVWTRFSAAKVPADQAVNAVPRDELIAIGSSLLLLFGFFGAIAVIAVYLIDRGGRVTPGVSRALLLLMAVEGVAAIMLVKGLAWQREALAVELFLIPVGAVLWSTFAEAFTRLDNSGLPTRKGRNERDAELKREPFRSWQGSSKALWVLLAHGLSLVLGAAVGSACLALLAGGSDLVVVLVGVTVLGLALILVVAAWVVAFYRGPVWRLQLAEWRAWEEHDEGEGVSEAEDVRPPKPPELELKPVGIVFVGLVMSAAVAGPSLLVGKWWLAASLGSTILLGIGLWRIASLTSRGVPSFMWFGLAVFISVPLFGTLTAMARNLEDPQVQPMALIRNTDGPEEAIQGLYVTETDTRIYFATVATEGCSDQLAAHSGRLLWVPKSEVVAMSIGPSQDIEAAANTALEMAYTLTPGAEAPGIEPGEPETVGETGSSTAEAEGPPLDKRLESVGPAVRPDFGRGLSLVPPDAAPGKLVTLRMSAPNRSAAVEGFGRAPEGRTLRLNGVPASIYRERTRSPRMAEYVKTEAGTVLSLAKESMRRVTGESGVQEWQVRLADDGVEEVVRNGEPTGDTALLLQGKAAWLAPGQKVKLKEGGEVSLLHILLRQAWHENWIRFQVPVNASSGPISVDCAQLSGQPVLQVSRPPTARIAVRMRAGSDRVTFDSAGSGAGEEVASRHWSLPGIGTGSGVSMSADLPPRAAAYSVTLTTEGPDGQADTAQLRLLRLPTSLFATDGAKPERKREVEAAGRSLIRQVRHDDSAELELDGHADNPGTPSYNLGLSMRRAENVRHILLPEGGTGTPTAIGRDIPVKTLAYGEACPLDAHPGRSARNRRVDVFVLERGISVVHPRGCRPGHAETTEWRPLPGPG
jgi:outer membrane protein OmpA-like peptidoglycan-associated protein